MLVACSRGIETPPVSWLGEWPRDIGAAARPSRRGTESHRFAARTSGTRQKTFSPYSRAAATAFHRLPVRGVSC